jgi:hypothetical protein
MAVTEQQRHRLPAWFEEQMGQDLGATTMMELLPPADASQLATKADIAELRADVKDDMLQLQRTFVTWLIASQAAVIAAFGITTGVIVGFT